MIREKSIDTYPDSGRGFMTWDEKENNKNYSLYNLIRYMYKQLI